jgi:hypothetical protein
VEKAEEVAKENKEDKVEDMEVVTAEEPAKDDLKQDEPGQDKAMGDKPAEDQVKEAKKPEESVEKQKILAAASSEEEIDDEEPELVIEEDLPPAAAAAASKSGDEDKVERLAAAGVSVTVIEKKKSLEAGNKAKEQQGSIGLSSDISVTVVHKKKVDVGPKISVKKESELLDPAAAKKDFVEVTTAKKPASVTSRKPSIEIESSHHSSTKVPPDPIVTISKVASGSSTASALPGGSSLLKNSSMAPSAPKSQSPALTRTPNVSVASSLNSLASILGQPRMSAAPVVSVASGPRFGVQGRSVPAPNVPRNSSPLMMASGPYRPATTGPMGAMPSLHPRPLLGGGPPAHPVTGPVSEQLNKVAGKLVDFMRGTLEELFKELSANVSFKIHGIQDMRRENFFIFSAGVS